MARFLISAALPVVRAAHDGGAADKAASGVAARAPEAATSEKAATSAEWRYVALSLVLVVVGLVAGWSLQNRYHPQLVALPQLVAGTSPFALLYVFAQSIERLLEVVSPLLGGLMGVAGGAKSTKGRLVQSRNTAWAAAVQSPVAVNKTAAAVAQHRVEQFRANSAAISFGLASMLAMCASGYLGMFLLHLTGVTSAGIVLDILVTGLAIGGGTKPLHDLITNVQKAKEAKQDPKELNA